MKSKYPILIIILTGFIITACVSSTEQPPIQNQPVPSGGGQSNQPVAALVSGWDQTVQIDEQGAVVFEITPLNLNTQDDTLAFEVALNTHSVDLGMDLASSATLTTDTGLVIQAATWEAPRGGHHVSGKLFFPSSVEGNLLLDGATRLILQIRDVDAPMRTFEWQFQ